MNRRDGEGRGGEGRGRGGEGRRGAGRVEEVDIVFKKDDLLSSEV